MYKEKINGHWKKLSLYFHTCPEPLTSLHVMLLCVRHCLKVKCAFTGVSTYGQIRSGINSIYLTKATEQSAQYETLYQQSFFFSYKHASIIFLLLQAVLICSDTITMLSATPSTIWGVFDYRYMTTSILTLFLTPGQIKAIPIIPLRLLDQVKFCTSTTDSALCLTITRPAVHRFRTVSRTRIVK